MKVLSIKINNSKSVLESFEWTSEKPINIFIGENGSGKSTLLRHLIDIFKNGYEYFVEKKKVNNLPDFDFEIQYELLFNNTVNSLNFNSDIINVILSGKKNRKSYWELRLDKDDKYDRLLKEKYDFIDLFPSNILAYYAGWDATIKARFLDVENRYKQNAMGNYKGLKNSDKLDTAFSTIERLPLIYLDKIHYSILFSILFSFEYNQAVEDYLMQKFSIQKVEENAIELKIIKPSDNFYTNSKEDFWGAKGELRVFLDNVKAKCLFRNIKAEDKDSYIFVFNLSKWYELREFYLTENRFYNYWHILNSSGFLSKIQVNFTKNNLLMNNFMLSEGEQQQLTIFALKEVLIDTNSLVMLDEPETFLHPRWQQRFIRELSESLENNISSLKLPFHNQPNFFISTHSLNLLNNSNYEISSLTILKGGKVIQKVEDFYGRTIRSINHDLMGLEERPVEVKELINELYDLVENERLEEAIEKLKELLLIVGENDEDVIQLKIEIDFLKALQND